MGARLGDGQATALGPVLLPLLFVEFVSGALQVYFMPLYGEIGQRFGVDSATMSWTLTGWILATVVAIPLVAKLGDVYGHRTVLRVDVALVAIGTILVAAAPNFAVLLLGRILQGALAAFLPLMFGLIKVRFAPDDTRRAVARLSSIVLFGAMAGSVAVGLFTKYGTGAIWALWLPAVGTVVGFAALWVVPPAARHVRPTEARIDWLGALILAAGMVLTILGISEGPQWGWSSLAILGCLTGGIILLLVWGATALHVAHPLIDLRHLLHRSTAPIYVIGAAVYAAFLGGQYAIATYMALPKAVGGLGLTPAAIGLAVLPAVFAAAGLSAAATSLIGRIIGYPCALVLGSGIAAAGFAGIVLWHRSVVAFAVLFAFAAVGNGIIATAPRAMVVARMKPEETGIGSGLYELSITTGAALGSAIAAAVLAANTAPHQLLPAPHGYVVVWELATVLCLIAVGAGTALALYLRRQRSLLSAATVAI
ncbi:MAG: MFS transporter [Actinomycetota bacterium]|nr:MFS transporter [Actinomycetota bacterium]